MLCPICKKTVPSPAANESPSKHVPFCSDRCKLIDLGRWLDGKYQIPVVDREDKHGSAEEDDLHPPRRR